MVKPINISFKNMDKMFPKNVIRKMRQEDLRTFYVKNKGFMSSAEELRFTKKMLGRGATSYPSGNEFFVERKGDKLKFINFDE